MEFRALYIWHSCRENEWCLIGEATVADKLRNKNFLLRFLEIESKILIVKNWQKRKSIYLQSGLFLLLVSHHCIFSGFWMCTLQVGWMAWSFTLCYIGWNSTINIFNTIAFSTTPWNREWHGWMRWLNWLRRVQISRKVKNLVRWSLILAHVNRLTNVKRWSNRSVL